MKYRFRGENLLRLFVLVRLLVVSEAVLVLVIEYRAAMTPNCRALGSWAEWRRVGK